MANNPVQVVLQTDQYMKLPEGGGGGGAKDFYEDRDEEFKRHKQQLLKQVESIRTALSRTGPRQVGYVKVRLQSNALAKSHRPVDALFKPKSLPLVGSGALGELYFEVTPDTLESVADAISGAEEKVTKRDAKNKLQASAARSETGAIEEIALPSLQDKRAFSFETAIDHFERWPGARYFTVELFVDEESLDGSSRNRAAALAELQRFRTGLEGVSRHLKTWASGEEWRDLHITTVQIPASTVKSRQFNGILEAVIQYLDHSPLVRRYALGAVVTRGQQSVRTSTRTAPALSAALPKPQPGIDYPIVGVVDAGISRKKSISAWSAGTVDYMREPDSDRDHGTFIAGLLINGASFNPNQRIEQDPCKFFDYDLFTEDEDKFEGNFQQGFIDMMRQLDQELSGSKPENMRVINLSLNPESMTDQNGYSPYAAILDEIADKHDVIFVISAGNLESAKSRSRWPDSATPALQQLATYRQLGADRIYVPGETARNLTVGALEPIDHLGLTRPARYSRRGPATSAGIKPDFAHVGGCLATNNPLKSLDHAGDLIPDEGTSFAAPLVAKTLAILDHRIEGRQPRDVLMALMYHFAKMPALLDDKLLNAVSKDFAGFGIPGSVDDMLATDDTSITLVFQDTLKPRMELSFDFEWPSVLVENGSTRGEVELTIVYSPPFDRRHQAEFTRVNLDAYLRQETVNKRTGKFSYSGRLKPDHPGVLEKNLIAHGAKWWPVKRYSRTFSRLEGTSNWRLVVDSLTRAGADYPESGVTFAVILTISDPEKRADVFASARRALVTKGVSLRDVRTQARARAR
ncbi:S8 family peptidase [Pseudomonas sp. RIT288]|jgi:subtilisin family serine protease|uniref:S8 family peptidase n=1 Tax=Pseudomonas sp. RIT288 TaxID=1470589 RepID=UPI0004516199|nr:S8 family peptidase [Pseudomonas sp. RIT288]EZP33975.1 peptidase S8 and S53 subtilisin kexin sedolisin [Pseudomonas sp. RIT288]